MEERAKPGDIFTQQLKNGKYMFGRVLIDIKTQCFDSNMLRFETSGIKEYAYSVEVYDVISDSPVIPTKYKVVIKGIGVNADAYEEGAWKIIGFKEVDPHDVGFQENIGYDDEEIYYDWGEISLTCSISEDDVNDTIEGLDGTALLHSQLLIEHVFDLLETGDKTELIDYDMRLIDKESRDIIFNALGEDPTMSYYDLALKHGFDTSRFFNNANSGTVIPKESNTNLLNGIAWSFIGDTYSNQTEFMKALNEEGISLSTDTLVRAVKIRILCEYLDEEDEDHELLFELKPDNGESFDGNELLFKIHNKVVKALDDNDYHFFEGLTLLSNPNEENLSYSIDLGN